MSVSPPQIPQPGDAYRNASAAWLKEIIRQGELRLQCQLQAAIAADARAGVLASIQAAASAALIVFGAQSDIVGTVEAAAYSAAAPLFIGALMSAWSARPVAFFFPGLEPKDWLPAVDTDEPRVACDRAYAEYLDDYLKDNARFMKRNGRWLTASLGTLALAPVFAIAALLLVP